ncbi:hypothetical protein COOONC_25012, partial [Cooperia oncophora]
LQTVSSNLAFSGSRRRLSELCSSGSALKSHSPIRQPVLEFHRLDLSEDVIEECNLEEDRDESPVLLQQQNDVVLSEADNEAAFFQKLISDGCASLSDVEEEDPVELCGPENEPDNYDDIKTSTIHLKEDSQRFQYERPSEEGIEGVRKYSLEEMEKLFSTFNDVLIL